MTNEPMPNQTPALCASCNSTLHGEYCHHCGEKRIEPGKDLSLLAFLRETIQEFLSFDTKVLKSYLVFFTKPGELTKAWILGQRNRYIKPLTMFLAIAVAVHFFLPNTNVYFESMDSMTLAYEQKNPFPNVLQYNMGGAIVEKSKKLGISHADFYRRAFQNCWEKSKLFLVAIVPFWGLAIWGLMWGRNRYFLPHLVFAFHAFAFFMAIDLIFLLIVDKVLKAENISDEWFIPLLMGYGIYLWVALRKVYGKMHWGIHALRFLGVLFSLVVCIVLYRQFVTVFTVMSM
jgi:Protein of unknown function (DUF3667)